MNIESKELTEIKGQVSQLERMAYEIEINNNDDHVKAIDLLSKFKEAGSNIKAKKESITKPLNEALKNARTLFAPIEQQFEFSEKLIKGKLLDYTKKVNEEARKKEAQLAARVEKGTMKIETATKKIEQIEKVEKTTHGNIGKAQIRKIKKVRIANETLIPREYLKPDEVAIRRDALGGKSIPGVEVYEEEIMA